MAQFGSVSALGAESRRFESYHPDLEREIKRKGNKMKWFIIIWLICALVSYPLYKHVATKDDLKWTEGHRIGCLAMCIAFGPINLLVLAIIYTIDYVATFNKEASW